MSKIAQPAPGGAKADQRKVSDKTLSLLDETAGSQLIMHAPNTVCEYESVIARCSNPVEIEGLVFHSFSSGAETLRVGAAWSNTLIMSFSTEL